MGMRVTTGMAMNTYRYNLQNSTASMTDSRNKVLSHRKFDSFAEDPSSAVQAWRVRRAMVSTNSYQKNNKDTLTRFDIAWTTMGSASHDLTDLDGRDSDIRAASDPTATGRVPLGKVLHETAESVIQTLNGAKSGENFVFSGDDELNAPFTWNADKTILYYRGVNVNAGQVKSPAEAPCWAPQGADGKPLGNTDAELAQKFLEDNVPAAGEGKDANEEAWIAYYRDTTGTVVQPTPDADNPVPDWVPMDNSVDPAVPRGNTEADLAAALKDAMPEKGENDIEQAWVDYYKNGGTIKPSENPAATWEAIEGLDDFGAPKVVDKLKDDPTTDAYNRAWAAYLADQRDVVRLDRMAAEEAPIDLGMGMMEEESGKLIPGTYFNRTLPGINMLGYGVDEDGDPKNACMILKRLGEIYSACTGENGAYASDEDCEEAQRLINKLKDAQSYVSGQYVDISAQASYLKQNEQRLNLQASYLNEHRAELEDVDLADAIINFSWDYYCYSAALKVGTQVLSQSLIDYMR